MFDTQDISHLCSQDRLWICRDKHEPASPQYGHAILWKSGLAATSQTSCPAIAGNDFYILACTYCNDLLLL